MYCVCMRHMQLVCGRTRTRHAVTAATAHKSSIFSGSSFAVSQFRTSQQMWIFFRSQNLGQVHVTEQLVRVKGRLLEPQNEHADASGRVNARNPQSVAVAKLLMVEFNNSDKMEMDPVVGVCTFTELKGTNQKFIFKWLFICLSISLAVAQL